MSTPWSIYMIGFFLVIFIFIAINHIISLTKKLVFGYVCPKFSLSTLLRFCLIFCQFQPGVAYKSVAYRKACRSWRLSVLRISVHQNIFDCSFLSWNKINNDNKRNLKQKKKIKKYFGLFFKMILFSLRFTWKIKYNFIDTWSMRNNIFSIGEEINMVSLKNIKNTVCDVPWRVQTYVKTD